MNKISQAIVKAYSQADADQAQWETAKGSKIDRICDAIVVNDAHKLEAAQKEAIAVEVAAAGGGTKQRKSEVMLFLETAPFNKQIKAACTKANKSRVAANDDPINMTNFVTGVHRAHRKAKAKKYTASLVTEYVTKQDANATAAALKKKEHEENPRTRLLDVIYTTNSKGERVVRSYFKNWTGIDAVVDAINAMQEPVVEESVEEAQEAAPSDLSDLMGKLQDPSFASALAALLKK